MSETILEIKDLKKILRRYPYPPRTFPKSSKRGSRGDLGSFWLW